MAKHGKARQKMSNRKFKTLVLVPVVIVALLAVILTIAGSVLGSTLDTYVGKGGTHIEAPADSADFDATYYTVDSEGSN